MSRTLRVVVVVVVVVTTLGGLFTVDAASTSDLAGDASIEPAPLSACSQKIPVPGSGNKYDGTLDAEGNCSGQPRDC